MTKNNKYQKILNTCCSLSCVQVSGYIHIVKTTATANFGIQSSKRKCFFSIFGKLCSCTCGVAADAILLVLLNNHRNTRCSSYT